MSTAAEPLHSERPSRIVWFEIPASDLDRAARFYETILGIQLMRDPNGPFSDHAVFPYQAPAVSGAVVRMPTSDHPAAGPIPYLNADPNLDAVLSRVEAAGGKILLGRTDLPPGMGAYARIIDPDNNIVGLHAK